MKRLLLIVLLLSLGFSQKLTEVDRGYYENGQKSYEGTIKDGKPDGLFTSWYENGQKEEEGIFKDKEQDGLWTSWYKNGQKKDERTYKDGKVISKKEWNEDGSVKE